jgi:hypothetical protein
MRPVMACARWAAQTPERSVEQERQRPCPSDPLGIWSPFGCPGDSCSSPLLPTTSAEPTTTQPTTTQPTTTQPTTTEPATTKTGPPILRGDQPALGSGATAGALLPVIGLLYLLRGLLPQPGGTHARQRGAKLLHRHR